MIAMRLSDKLTTGRIRIPLVSTTKDDVLEELVSLLPGAADEDTREQLLGAVLEREAKMSTGIGQGVAIPHGKSDLVADTEMAFGITAQPIDFASLDGKPVSIFFLLISGTERSGPHIKALAQISRLLSSNRVRDGLTTATTADDVRELLSREETALGDP
jgi:mannitol/fructose-specific phosphotransferase system IIA component (Ntr-type)